MILEPILVIRSPRVAPISLPLGNALIAFQDAENDEEDKKGVKVWLGSRLEQPPGLVRHQHG